MSGRRSGWTVLGDALLQLLRQSSRRSGSAKLRGSEPQPTLRDGRAPNPQSSRTSGSPELGGSQELGSPGQSGASATRDLLPEERSGLRFEYAPNPDRDPDPGEVVWTWVPYVENDGRGKDRPVLIIARLDERSVVGCYLSTKEHRGFVYVGTGGWDPQHRGSYLSPERLLRITHEGMRREGHALERERFVEAARSIAQYWGIRA